MHDVTTVERTKRVKIERRLDYGAEPGSFTYGHSLKEGEVQPGGPFTGSATYSGGHLTGDLAVALPGLTVPVKLAPSRAGLSRKGPLTDECDRVFGMIKK
jgi:hypothetical protein